MRRLVIILTGLAVALVTAVLLLPWWLGPAITAIGPSFGMTFGKYERDGYGRFHLETVEVRREVVTVKVQSVKCDTPIVWLWRRLTRSPGVIAAGSWTVDGIRAKSGTAVTTKPGGWTPLREKLNTVADHLAHWLPRASAGPGKVAWPGGGLTFESVEWQNRVLTTSGVTYRALKGAVRLTTPQGKGWRAIVTTPDTLGGANLVSEGATVHGTVKWWGQSGDISGTFGKLGWMPTEASLRSSNWDISGEKVRLSGHYAHIRGNALLEWRDGNLTADVNVAGEPLAPSQAPPIKITLHGRGGNNVFVAERLSVQIPGVTAALSEPVTIDREGHLKSAPSRFTFEANLAEQPWLQARGKLRGEGRIAAAESGIASIDFSMAGEDVAVEQIEAKAIDVAGRFAWPVLEIRNGKMVAKDGHELTVKGGWNFRTRELHDGRLSGTIGRAAIARWVPASVQFGTVALDARGEGRWPDLKHEGHGQAKNVRFPQVNPVALEVNWRGTGLGIQEFTGVASSGGSKVETAGSFDRNQLRVNALSLINGDAPRLRLTQPVSVSWKPHWRIGPVNLQGPESAIDGAMTWGKTGEINLNVRHLDPRWFRDFLTLRSSAWIVDAITLNGHWANGPIQYSGNAHASIALGDERVGHIGVDLRGDGQGLEIVSLRGAEGQNVIVDATGRLPIRFRPTQSPFAQIDFDAPFVVNAATSSNPKFWDQISSLTGIDIVEPEVTARLEGTLTKPKGDVRLKADRLAAVPGRYKFEWPKIEALDVQLAADSSGVKLNTFSVRVDGQLVRAQGTLPVSGERWRDLLQSPRTFVRQGDLRIEVPDAEIAAIAHHFPDYLAPKGRLKIDLTFKPDETISGFLKLSDATSRPLGPLGVLQEVNADVRFGGRSVTLDAVTARMGGQLVTLQGKAELPRGDEPQLDLVLKGENLPFVRRAGLLVRGDLDLKLTSARGRTAIGGDVHLRDSLFLADLASLIPTGAKETARRPPYFSVEAVPLNAWTLDVNVTGERFMRLRTPVFNGTASAHFKLGGTLGIPRATGEAVIDEGNIRLPFASFEVRQGQVRLTPEQPEPQREVGDGRGQRSEAAGKVRLSQEPVAEPGSVAGSQRRACPVVDLGDLHVGRAGGRAEATAGAVIHRPVGRPDLPPVLRAR